MLSRSSIARSHPLKSRSNPSSELDSLTLLPTFTTWHLEHLRFALLDQDSQRGPKERQWQIVKLCRRGELKCVSARLASRLTAREALTLATLFRLKFRESQDRVRLPGA